MPFELLEHWVGVLSPELPTGSRVEAHDGEGEHHLSIRMPGPAEGAPGACLLVDLVISPELAGAYQSASAVARGAADTELLHFLREQMNDCRLPDGEAAPGRARVIVLRPRDLHLVV